MPFQAVLALSQLTLVFSQRFASFRNFTRWCRSVVSIRTIDWPSKGINMCLWYSLIVFYQNVCPFWLSGHKGIMFRPFNLRDVFPYLYCSFSQIWIGSLHLGQFAQGYLIQCLSRRLKFVIISELYVLYLDLLFIGVALWGRQKLEYLFDLFFCLLRHFRQVIKNYQFLLNWRIIIIFSFRFRMNQVRQILHLLDPIASITTLSRLDTNQKIKIIQEKTTIKPSQIVLLIIIALSLFGLSYFMKFSSLLVWFVCYFFPAYFSLKALLHHDSENCTRYMVYWILFPILGWSYPLFKMMLSRSFFAGFRILITIALLYPKLNLAGKLYNNVIRPFLQNQGKSFAQGIDHAIQQGEQLIQNMAGKINKKKQEEKRN